MTVIPHDAEIGQNDPVGDNCLNSAAAPSELPTLSRQLNNPKQAPGEHLINQEVSGVSSLELIYAGTLPLDVMQNSQCINEAVLLLNHLRMSDPKTPASDHAAAVCELACEAYFAGVDEGEKMVMFRLGLEEPESPCTKTQSKTSSNEITETSPVVPHRGESAGGEQNSERLNGATVSEKDTTPSESNVEATVPNAEHTTIEQPSGTSCSDVTSLELILDCNLPLTLEDHADCVTKAVLVLERLRLSDARTPVEQHADFVWGILYEAFTSGEWEGEWIAELAFADS